MAFTNQAIKFHSDALPEDTLLVAKLSGQEEISGLFRFDLELVSTDKDIDLAEVLYAPAKVGLAQPLGGDLKTFNYFKGCLEEFKVLEQGPGFTRYEAVLIPDMAKLRDFYRSRVFLDKDVVTIVKEVLNDSVGLAEGDEVKVEVNAESPTREYVVQYEESDFDFVSRWLEHEGLYYYFDNDGVNESLTVADGTGSYKPIRASVEQLPYRPEGDTESQGVDSADREEEVQSIVSRVSRLPREVMLNDYNWRDPSTKLQTKKDVHEQGEGLQIEYNDHYKDASEGDHLADVRKEELTCRSQVFAGVSTCRAFRPGRTFELIEHFRSDFNHTYLLTKVVHAGEQSLNLDAATVAGARYRNSFEAISADLVFRPERKTDWPNIKGFINAKIDAADGSTHADIDEHGRYKVRMPFDQNEGDADAGQASRWIRKAEPYAGVDSGMHFPLLANTEVIISHVDGDPDRPVIVGCMPNPETVSPVNSVNPLQNRMQTTNGNLFLMDDHPDATGMVFVSGDGRFISDYRSPVAEGGGGVGVGAGGVELGARPRSVAPQSQPEVAAQPEQERKQRAAPEQEAERQPAVAGAAPAVKGQGEPKPEAPPQEARQAQAGEKPGRHPRSLPLPPQVLERMGLNPGDGMASNVVSGETSFSSVQTIMSQYTDVFSRARGLMEGKGANLSATDYYLDSKVWGGSAPRYVMLVGDVVQIQTGGDAASWWKFDDVGNTYTWGTGGYSYSHTDGDNTSESYHFGDDDSSSTHIGNSKSFSLTEGTKSSQEFYMSASDSLTIGLGATASFEMIDSAVASLSIITAAKTETEFKQGILNSNSFFMGGKLSIDMNLSVELSIEAQAGSKTKINLTPNINEVELIPMKNKFGLVKSESELSKVKTQLNEVKTRLQNTETQVSDIDTKVQETNTKVQEMDTKVQETFTSVQATETLVQITETMVQQTVTNANETVTTAMVTRTAAMRTMSAGLTMIN